MGLKIEGFEDDEVFGQERMLETSKTAEMTTEMMAAIVA